MLNKNKIKLRPVKQYQVSEIKKYILNNIHEQNIYLPPLVATTNETHKNKPQSLNIIDGSKRLMALKQIPPVLDMRLKNDERLKETYLAEAEIKNTSIAVQVYENLNEKEQDQLYIDFNTKGKKVTVSKRIAYDSRNDINHITKEILLRHVELREDARVEMEKHNVVKPSNTKLISLSQLRKLVSVFIRGSVTKKDLNKSKIDSFLNREQYINLIQDWFDLLFDCHPAKTIGDYNKTILASWPMLLAVCTYANEGLEAKNIDQRQVIMTERMEKIKKIDWSIHNKKWLTFDGEIKGVKKCYYLSDNKKNLENIISWLKSF